MHPLIKYLVPQIPSRDILAVFGWMAIGSLIAGFYGILHDQITYSIGPEYFTQFKFDQFKWADLGFGNRVFVSCIGFLATWWVGMIVAWILSRRLLPNQSRRVAGKKILKGFLIVFVTGLIFGVGGYVYGIVRGPDGDYTSWAYVFYRLGITDEWSFMRVAYIHNAGYLGGLTGLILSYFLIPPAKAAPPE